jgi:hypothetical protein
MKAEKEKNMARDFIYKNEKIAMAPSGGFGNHYRKARRIVLSVSYMYNQ